MVSAVVTGFRAGKSGQFAGRLAGALGFQIPEGAVERVARGTGGQGALQGLAVEAARNRFGHAFQRGGFALDRLVIAGDGHAFAPADKGAIP